MKTPEAFDRAVASAVPRLPDSVLRALGGRAVRIDGQELDPEIRFGVRLAALNPQPAVAELTVAEARARTRREARTFRGREIALPQVRELRVPGAAGELAARHYLPPGAPAGAPMLLWLHPGGWVVGDLETDDQFCRYLAWEAGVAILSVDYRLAPEHPFPAAADDALAALRHLRAQPQRFGADPRRIAIGGASAGGNLAAVVCQDLRAGGEEPPRFQLLVYPVTDAAGRSHSYELFREGFYLTAEKMEWYFDHYLPAGSDRDDPRASPLRADDLTGLPPAIVHTAGFDILRDEAEAYAARLRDAGVEVALTRHPGLVHGFASAVGVGGSSRRAVEELVRDLRSALARQG